MEKEIKNLIDMIITKGDETVKNLTNELFMSEHFATAVEKIINTKGMVDSKVKLVLNTMNVASKMDIDELNDRLRKVSRDIAKLQKLVEELKATMQPEAKSSESSPAESEEAAS